MTILVPTSSDTTTNTNTLPNEECSKLRKLLGLVKHALSMSLILFSVAVISTAIFTKQTTATGKSGVHPIVALLTFWLTLLWLAVMEGGLNCMVGLQPIDKDLYQETHSKTLRCTTLAHRGDNIERFIVGRQYLDLTILFTTSFMVSAVDGASVFGLPQVVNDIFLKSGLAVMLCTIVFGQLTAQINSSNSMLDFMNNWIMVGSTYVALFVERSGILHAVYLVQICFTKLAGKQVETKEPPKSVLKKILFWLRVLMSLAISVFAIVVFMTALMGGNTPVNEKVPKGVSIASLFVLLLLGGFMEALQIAFFTVKHWPSDRVQASPYAARILHLIFQQGKLAPFLVGRQIAQTVIMFMIARIITVDMKDGQDNLFGVSDGVQSFFNSGLLNALVSTIFASLSWRVTANAFPMLFLSNPIAIWIIRFCLAVEGTGICDSAWIFAKIQRNLLGYQFDTVFIPGSTLGLLGNDESKQDDSSDLELAKQDSSSGTGSESDDRGSEGESGEELVWEPVRGQQPAQESP